MTLRVRVGDFVNPPFAGRKQPAKSNRFVRRKGWGTHGVAGIPQKFALHSYWIELLSGVIRFMFGLEQAAGG